MYALPDLGPLLTAADFEPHVGKTFLVDARPKPLEIRLEKIVYGRDDPVVPRLPFILIFTSAVARPVALSQLPDAAEWRPFGRNVSGTDPDRTG